MFHRKPPTAIALQDLPFTVDPRTGAERLVLAISGPASAAYEMLGKLLHSGVLTHKILALELHQQCRITDEGWAQLVCSLTRNRLAYLEILNPTPADEQKFRQFQVPLIRGARQGLCGEVIHTPVSGNVPSTGIEDTAVENPELRRWAHLIHELLKPVKIESVSSPVFSRSQISLDELLVVDPSNPGQVILQLPQSPVAGEELLKVLGSCLRRSQHVVIHGALGGLERVVAPFVKAKAVTIVQGDG